MCAFNGCRIRISNPQHDLIHGACEIAKNRKNMQMKKKKNSDPHERIVAFLKKRASKGQIDYTFSELRSVFSDLDPSELLVEIHRLSDEWILNEVSLNCYSLNKKFLKAYETTTPGVQTTPRVTPENYSVSTSYNNSGKPTYYEQRQRISPKFLQEIKSESKRFVPIIKKIVVDLATEYAKTDSSSSQEYSFNTHLINRCIRKELGDVFDSEHLRLYSHYALEELTETWFLRKQDRVRWAVSLEDLGIETESLLIEN